MQGKLSNLPLRTARMMRTAQLRFSGVLPVAIMVVACIGGGKGLSNDDKARLGAYVLAAPPANVKSLDIDFDGKVHLVGYRVEPETAAPGTEVKITMYWRCDAPTGEGWNLFTHIVNGQSGQLANLDWNGPIREPRGDNQILGPARWERGKVYVDAQTFTVPEGDSPSTASTATTDWVVRAGVWKGDDRIKVLSGPQDGSNAAIVAQFKSAKSAALAAASDSPLRRDPQAVPELSVPRLAAGETIVVDGKADEPAWLEAAGTGAFVNVATGMPSPESPVGGTAKLLWSESHFMCFST
jgi:hypothetical protein